METVIKTEAKIDKKKKKKRLQPTTIINDDNYINSQRGFQAGIVSFCFIYLLSNYTSNGISEMEVKTDVTKTGSCNVF